MDLLATVKLLAGLPWATAARLWRWLRRADRLQQLETENQELRALVDQVDPHEGFWQMHGLWWRFEPAENRNVPFCPVCLSGNKRVPLDRQSRTREGETQWTLVCPAHDWTSPPMWRLDPEAYDSARGHGIPAGRIAFAGIDRVRGEPVTSPR